MTTGPEARSSDAGRDDGLGGFGVNGGAQCHYIARYGHDTGFGMGTVDGFGGVICDGFGDGWGNGNNDDGFGRVDLCGRGTVCCSGYGTGYGDGDGDGEGEGNGDGGNDDGLEVAS